MSGFSCFRHPHRQVTSQLNGQEVGALPVAVNYLLAAINLGRFPFHTPAEYGYFAEGKMYRCLFASHNTSVDDDDDDMAMMVRWRNHGHRGNWGRCDLDQSKEISHISKKLQKVTNTRAVISMRILIPFYHSANPKHLVAKMLLKLNWADHSNKPELGWLADWIAVIFSDINSRCWVLDRLSH